MVAVTETSPEVDSKDLVEFLLRLGDNSLILAHRASEWCGHSPVLEEDIALANTALDLIGQARLWFELAGQIEGKGRTADNLAYLRDAWDFRNVLLVELPNGDFGNTLMRQFLFDAWHLPMLQALAGSADRRIAEIAEKAVKEAAYHLKRSSDLVIRLGDGTAESHRRMQEALDLLWAYTGELLTPDRLDATLAAARIAPDAAEIAKAWARLVDGTLRTATLKKPQPGYMHKGGKTGVHTEHLGFILAQMQFLQRAYPGATW